MTHAWPNLAASKGHEDAIRKRGEVAKLPLVAHNASFDKKFFESECRLAGIKHDGQFACSMLIARRVFPESPNHKLGTLVNHLKIRKTGQFHRALSDAEMTAQLVLAMHKKFSNNYGVTIFPGMQVIASIRTGERTVLEYLADPFLNTLSGAMGER